MDSLKPTYQVILNTLAASAGDVVVNDRNLVVGPSSNASPRIHLSHDCKVTRQYPVNETAAVYTYTPSAAAASTTYGFTLFQNVDGVMRKVVVEYTSPLTAPASTTVICDLLRSALTKYINTGKIKVTSNANGNATVVVTGATGYPLFDMSAVQAGTSAQTLPTALTISGLNITTGVVTTGSQTLVSGDLVSITGATGVTFTRNGVTTTGAIANAPIHVINTTTFILLGVTTGGSNGTAGSVVKQPSESAGLYADVIAQTADQGATVTPVSGRKYAKYTFEYANQVSSLNSMSRFQSGAHILFVDSYFDTGALASHPFLLFDVGLNNVINGATVNTGTASTTVNIELLANPSVSN
jgi:hypothetical protein